MDRISFELNVILTWLSNSQSRREEPGMLLTDLNLHSILSKE